MNKKMKTKDTKDSTVGDVVKIATDFTHVHVASVPSNSVLIYRLEELVDMAASQTEGNIDKFMLHFPAKIKIAIYKWFAAAQFDPMFTESCEPHSAALSESHFAAQVKECTDAKIRSEVKLCNFDHITKSIIEELGRDFFTPVNDRCTYVGSCDLEGIDDYVSNPYSPPMLHDPNDCFGMNRLELSAQMSPCSRHVQHVDVACSPYLELNYAHGTLKYSLPPWMLTDDAAKPVIDIRKYGAITYRQTEYLKYVEDLAAKAKG